MKRCPLCQKKIPTPDPKQAPFCSSGCKAMDLNRWLKGTYAIPSEEAVNEEDIINHLQEPPEPN